MAAQSRPSLLLAEDDDGVRSTLTFRLEIAGFDVVAVADGEAAFQVLQSEQAPAIVITDWRMPRVDGLALVRRIRADPLRRDLPVIVLTGFDPPYDDDLSTLFVRKGQPWPELLATIERSLAGAAGQVVPG
jgi:CheY-like chemotaxis protein